jgi:hypothetical protein
MSPRESRFDTRAEYAAALGDVLARSASEILVFDPDLEATGLRESSRVDALGRMLSDRRAAGLKFVLHESGYAERHCPRLLRLAALHVDRVVFRQSPEDLRHLRDCFILGDRRHAAIRFHSDHARGKLLIDAPEEVAHYARRFDELWALCVPILSPTKLGL